MKKKVLILKNDRGGDLLNSIKSISSLLNISNDVTIFLSPFNHGFSFLFKKALVKKINYNLNIFNKIYLFFFVFKNNFDEIYILAPKNFYFFLPFIFRKIKFFGVTVNSFKRYRPNTFLRKFLFKFIVINRKNINKKSSSDMQLELINDNTLIDASYKNLDLPYLEDHISTHIPNNYLLVQFKETFFEKIDLLDDNFIYFLNEINKKFKNIVLFSDIENTSSNRFFIENFNFINCDTKEVYFKSKNPNIIYLHKVNAENLFSLVEKSNNILCPHGLLTHMARFYKKKNLNLFNFIIQDKSDLKHQKIAFSEWYKNMNIKFTFLNNNKAKTIKKVLKSL
jgi:hypothetical protein